MNPVKLLWSFYGRIGRLSYLGGLLLNLSLAAAAMAALIYLGQGQPKPPPGGTPDLLVYIFISGLVLFTWAKLALAAKRFHDLGKSGWLSVVLFIPLFGFIAIIFLLVAPGDDYDNQYGLSRSSGLPSSVTFRAV